MPKILTNLDFGGVARPINVPAPTLGHHAANKDYVDSVAQGLSVKEPVRLVATANIPLVGHAALIDGQSTNDGERILVTGQSVATQNGIYVAGSGAWARAADLPAGASAKGTFCFVTEGTTYADSGWVCASNAGADTVGTHALSFVQFSGAGLITAGNALTKTGNILDVNVDNVTIEISGSDQLRTKAGVAFDDNKVTALIGNGSATTIDVTHALGTKDVVVTIRDAGTDEVVIADVIALSTTQVRFTFAQAPAVNAIRVTIIG